MRQIVLFDGFCNLCDETVQFIIRHDPKENFQFASLQSDIGQELMKNFQVPNDVNSVILIKGERFYTQSSAALHICRGLEGPWKCFALLWIIPRPIRDIFYRIVAKNRYRWFGKKQACMMPTPEIKKRFL